MPTEAVRRAIKKYQTEKVEEIKFRVPKGRKKQIQEYAASRGESTTAFLIRAIAETMERDQAGTD